MLFCEYLFFNFLMEIFAVAQILDKSHSNALFKYSIAAIASQSQSWASWRTGWFEFVLLLLEICCSALLHLLANLLVYLQWLPMNA